MTNNSTLLVLSAYTLLSINFLYRGVKNSEFPLLYEKY